MYSLFTKIITLTIFLFTQTLYSQTSCPSSSTSSTNDTTIKVDSGVLATNASNPFCTSSDPNDQAICFAMICIPVRESYSPTIVVEKDGVSYNFNRDAQLTTSSAGNCEINYEPDDVATPNFANPYDIIFSLLPGTTCPYASSGVLPVELMKFNISYDDRDQEVDLNWIIAREENNSHFELYRSGRDLEMELVASIEGAGTTNQTIRYEFSDSAPLSGENYYALFQEDFDGTRKALGLQVIELEKQRMEVEVYPNPATDQMTLKLSDYTELPVEIRIYNTSGQLARQLSVDDFSTVLRVDELEKGMYHMQVNDGKKITTQRFLKH